MAENILKDFHKPLIIAEIGQNHDGSLGMCHAYIDALADIGVHAVKFQAHIAAEESTFDEAFRVNFSYQDPSRYEYWRRVEFTEKQWQELKNHADSKDIAFLCTPFSTSALIMLERIGVSAWKIGSGDTESSEILDQMTLSNKPIIVSTGMSSWLEIDQIVARLSASLNNFSILQCTSKYPTPLFDVGLNVMEQMKTRYRCRVGLSDHSGSPTPAMVAISRGFNLIEVHVTFDKRMFGPDVSSSLTIEQIGALVNFSEDVKTLDNHIVDKNLMAETLLEQKELFRRSVALKHDLPQGYTLRIEDLSPKKPGNGIPWSKREQVLGKALKEATPSNRLLKLEDIV